MVENSFTDEVHSWIDGMVNLINARNGYTLERIAELTQKRDERETAYRARQKCRNCISWELRDRSDKHSVNGRCHRLSLDLRRGLYWEEEFGPDDCCAWVCQGDLLPKNWSRWYESL